MDARPAERIAGSGPRRALEQDIRRVSDADALAISHRRQESLWSNTPASGCPGNWPRPAPSPEAVEERKASFDPNALTLGFARRFATYKRPNLLLHDRGAAAAPVDQSASARCSSSSPARRIRQDQAGQALIQEWIQFIRQPEVRPHVIFLSDYDMLLTEHLVQGVDVWINTPRRPWEACGTSGMKVLVNGGINLSELDGWWAEAYTPEVGWALGDGREHGDDPAWDAARSRRTLRPARARGGPGIL